MLIELERWMVPHSFDYFKRRDRGIYETTNFQTAGRKLFGGGYTKFPEAECYPKIASVGVYKGCCDTFLHFARKFAAELESDPRLLIVTTRHLPGTSNMTWAKGPGTYFGRRKIAGAMIRDCPNFKDGLFTFRVWNVQRLAG